MIRILFISSFILLLTLYARENPFFPSEGEKDLPVSSNENREKEPLKRVSITLPTQARILQKVTLEFKNLDGTVENKSLELDNSIDWHIPVLVSQGSIEVEKTKSPNKSDEKPNKEKSKSKESNYQTILSIKDISLSYLDKCLQIDTNDEVIRNFLLVDPHRIVIDFKKDVVIKNYTKKDEQSIFKEIRIGNHEGYYRVVVELDGLYRYDFKKITNGYKIELK